MFARGEEKMFKKQLQGKRGVTGLVMGLVFASILIIGVGIPIVLQVIQNAALTGITATIVGFIPVFFALVPLALAAAAVMRAGG